MKFVQVQKEDPSILTMEINGIDIPYSTNQRIVLNGEEKVVFPPQITYAQNGDMGRCYLSLARQSEIDVIGRITPVQRGWSAPVLVSAHVPPGYVYIDKNGYIMLNEDQATEYYVDADGDIGAVHFHKISEIARMAVFVKFPITRKPMTLKVWNDFIEENWQSLTAKDAALLLELYPTESPTGYAIPGDGIEVDLGSNTPYDEKKAFEKSHKESDTGLVTTGWNTFETFQAQLKRGWGRKVDSICINIQRAIDIESGLKISRKDGAQLHQMSILDIDYTIDPQFSWGLLGTGKIASRGSDYFAWMDTIDEKGFCKTIDDMTKLKLTFIKKKDLTYERRKPAKQTMTFLSRLLPAHYTFMGEKIENKKAISQGGWIKFKELEAEPGKPPAVLIWLKLPDGTPTALLDIKRKEHDPNGLGYAYILYPVWDNRDLYSTHRTGDQQLVKKAVRGWVHPIEHLNKCLTQFDNKVINPETREVTSEFPEYFQEWFYPSRVSKIGKLQKFITDYCGEYGDVASCYMRNGQPVLLDHARAVAVNTVAIDYGGIPLTTEEMWNVASAANEQWRICLGGNKQTNMRVRKYCLATPSGTPKWSGEGYHPARAGKQRAQLLHALKKVTMRVAIVKCDTQTQVFITPSGIEKQRTADAFMPMVLPTLEDAVAYLESLSEEEKENMPANFLKGINFKTWTNQEVTAWVVKARNTTKIGKLISARAEKFVPREIDQAILIENDYVDWLANTNIDLVIPVTELINKGAHTNMLRKCEEKLIEIEGRKVKAMVGDFTYFRSGAHSENIPPRWRNCRYKGLDGHVIMREIERMTGVEHIQEVNVKPALDILRAMKHIQRKYGIKLKQ